jgi:hypothetical protein
LILGEIIAAAAFATERFAHPGISARVYIQIAFHVV